MYALIGTWRMSLEGIEKSLKDLENGKSAADAMTQTIKEVEDFPYFKSVGYGGLPNENMEVELDSAFMDGTNFNFGAVAGVKNIKNPIAVARDLSKFDANNFLVGAGAEKYADQNGFERVNMLTDRAKIHYKNRIYQEKKLAMERDLKPYIGHDTVGVCALDKDGNIACGTSTSGLFMKKPGRVGDSPVIGSGLYADSEVGAATATGLGEDLMKGCISYEIVRLMKEGKNVQDACDQAVNNLDKILKKKRAKSGDLSVVAIDKDGNFGVATNIDGFSFVYGGETQEAKVYLCYRENDKTLYKEASSDWLDDYMKTRTTPLKLLEEE